MSRYRKDSTTVQITVSAIVFFLFSFIYIYFYQSSTLAYAQHILADGRTKYMPEVSAVLITVLLYVVQRMVYAYTRLGGSAHALTYLPSMAILALLTSVYPDGCGGLREGMWAWIFPFFIIGSVLVMKVARQWIGASHIENGILASHSMMVNIVIMTLMSLSVAVIGNGKHMFHQRMKTEKLIAERRYDDASRVGEGMLRTDTTMTYLTFLAMDKQGILGDSIFTHPIVGSSASLIRGENVELYILPKWTFRLRKSKDYHLCALLADRNLDGFARLLVRHYAINDSLPKHYKEALVVYQHLRSYPLTAYSNSVMEVDFRDLQQLLHTTHNKNERLFALSRNYRRTYWAYYYSK